MGQKNPMVLYDKMEKMTFWYHKRLSCQKMGYWSL